MKKLFSIFALLFLPILSMDNKNQVSETPVISTLVHNNNFLTMEAVKQADIIERWINRGANIDIAQEKWPSILKETIEGIKLREKYCNQ